MSAFVIDAFEFSRLKERAQGAFAVSDLSRLSAESVDQSGTISWSVVGGSDKYGHLQLALSVSGTVNLVCQRCLNALPFEIASESVLLLARDDADADAIEQMLDNDAIDVIVGTSALDVGSLVEDEALLALPVAPKHDVCPDAGVSELLQAKKESPFSVLKNLK
ncbi:YceD family protein [Herbaspirillum autotrophicum]|uniref:YceD family protein n=1 Tax=Herbaspirillum autotrophicum TaxID=180195 RepID=UPI000AFA9852|nr:YceD family protein [Herbaspirillum autotrophicum]